MAITPISDKAFAIMAMCDKEHKSYAITVDPIGQHIKFIWAFKINEEKAHKEKFDQKSVTGSVENDENFPGCPYCNTKQHYICGNCEKVICWHGQKTVTCPSCGFTGEIQYSDKIDLKGGRM